MGKAMDRTPRERYAHEPEFQALVNSLAQLLVYDRPGYDRSDLAAACNLAEQVAREELHRKGAEVGTRLRRTPIGPHDWRLRRTQGCSHSYDATASHCRGSRIAKPGVRLAETQLVCGRVGGAHRVHFFSHDLEILDLHYSRCLGSGCWMMSDISARDMFRSKAICDEAETTRDERTDSCAQVPNVRNANESEPGCPSYGF